MRTLMVSMCLLMACGTEHTRLAFPIEAAGQSAALVTDSGWSVTLTRAVAHLSTVRFFEGKVLLGQRSPWWRSLVVSEAWAHPGHYIAGEAMAELLTPIDLDLLAAEPTAWGTADGVTGDYGSVQLGFEPGGLEVEGTATKSGQTVAFSGQFAPPRALEGIRFEREMTSGKGLLSLRFDLAVVLSRVDFAQSGASTKPLDQNSPAFNGLARGVDDTSGYLVSWKEN